MPDDSLPPVDKAVLAFFEIVAFALGWGGVDRLLDGKSLLSVLPIFGATILTSYTGFKWPYIKTKLGSRFGSTIDVIANYRYRWGVVLVVFLLVTFWLSVGIGRILRIRRFNEVAAKAETGKIESSQLVQQETTKQAPPLPAPAPKPHQKYSQRHKPEPQTPPKSAQTETSNAPINSVIKNSGYMNGVEVLNTEIGSSANRSATGIINTPTGQISNLKIDNLKVTGDSSSLDKPTGIVGIKSEMNSDLLVGGSVECGGDALIEGVGGNTNIVSANNSINNGQLCRWLSVVDVMGQHRADVGTSIGGWQHNLEKSWATLPDEQRDKYRREFAELKQRLVDAAVDDHTYFRLLEDLRKTPPSFPMPDTLHYHH